MGKGIVGTPAKCLVQDAYPYSARQDNQENTLTPGVHIFLLRDRDNYDSGRRGSSLGSKRRTARDEHVGLIEYSLVIAFSREEACLHRCGKRAIYCP